MRVLSIRWSDWYPLSVCEIITWLANMNVPRLIDIDAFRHSVTGSQFENVFASILNTPTFAQNEFGTVSTEPPFQA
jgi:hypothetical protein